MQEIIIRDNEAGQRLDKFLAKYMDRAPKSFFYKMLRKKNITLNGKKAEGSEHLCVGDTLRLFLSEETIQNFTSGSGRKNGEPSGQNNGAPVKQRRELPKKWRPDVLYEDDHILLFNKPAGLLSQKSDPRDISLVEYLTAHLLDNGSLTPADLRTFHPGICNRLDRNTSGLVAAGKSLAGLQALNTLFRERSLHKYYRSIAVGEIGEPQRVSGWLTKDHASNQVRVYARRPSEEAQAIATEYTPLSYLDFGGRRYTYLEMNLLTGRSHQLRAHLASLGHPLIGDTKYGDPRVNVWFREQCALQFQLLHAYRLTLPVLEGALEGLSGKTVTAPLPSYFTRLLEQGGLNK